VNYSYYLFVALTFFASVLLFEGIYLMWNSYKGPEAKRIEKRLQAMSAGANHQNRLVKKRLLSKIPAVEKWLLEIPRIHQLDRIILQSGLNLSLAKFIGLMLDCQCF
jgi:tight adherence protein B